jgi:hypothetical protein
MWSWSPYTLKIAGVQVVVVTFPSVVVDFSALSNKSALIYCPTPAIHCSLF